MSLAINVNVVQHCILAITYCYRNVLINAVNYQQIHVNEKIDIRYINLSSIFGVFNVCVCDSSKHFNDVPYILFTLKPAKLLEYLRIRDTQECWILQRDFMNQLYIYVFAFILFEFFMTLAQFSMSVHIIYFGHLFEQFILFVYIILYISTKVLMLVYLMHLSNIITTQVNI